MQTESRPSTAYPWLDHYPPDVPPSIDVPDQSIWDALERVAASHPHQTAFLFQNYAMTFAQLRDHASLMASALSQAGVGAGDVILALLPNVPHFPVLYYGALRLGAAIAAAPPTAVQREIDYFVRDSGARVIVTLDLLYDNLGSVPESSEVDTVLVGSVTDFMPIYVRAAAPYIKRILKPKQKVPYGGKIQPMRRFMARGRGIRAEAVASPESIALLQYTGGTTGVPKAAMLTHRSLLSNALQMRTWFPHLREGEETILAVLPFFHVYGVTLVMHAGLLLAARTVLIAGGWVPAEIFPAIQRYRPTIFPGVPTLYVALLNDKRSQKIDLSSIHTCVCGGAPLPVEVKHRFEDLIGGHLYEGYGLTEASPVTHAQPHDGSGKPGSIGYPLPSTDARIVDPETGEPLPQGQEGELTVRGPQVMRGYWHRPDDTADVLRDGWLFTGDIARMESDGSFYIVDRRKDLIITGGENIYPREIEEVLFQHPSVQEAAVVGVPHSFGGEIAKAFIVLKPGATASKNDIIRFASERLSKHKVPRAVEFRTELPKSVSNKVLRRVLAEEERARTAGRQNRRRQPDQDSPHSSS